MKSCVKVASIIWVLFFVTVSCSSLKDKGDDFYEAGAYEQAANTYLKAIKEDPDDTEAVVGLQRSREKIIDTKLIEIRHSRLGGNRQSAIDMLLTLIQRQNAWNLYPKGQVAYTQQEEIKEGLKFVQFQNQTALRNGFPLKANVLLAKYQPVFKGSALGIYTAEANKVKAEGRIKCQKISKKEKANYPYYSEFVKKYCTNFEDTKRSKVQGKKAKLDGLYGKLKIKANIDGLSKEEASIFRLGMERAFAVTPWYDPSAKQPMRIKLKGSFINQHDRIPEIRVHQYSVNVPYTAYENVRKSKRVPYSDREYNCKYSYMEGKQICGYDTVTKYRKVDYYEKEPVTRYRKEPRTQSYHGFKHHQVLKMVLSGNVVLGNYKRKLTLSQRTNNQGFEHSFNMPDIGLRPESAGMANPVEWVKVQANSLANQMVRTTKELWHSLYCKPVQGSSLAATGNQVNRCLRLELKNPPSFVEQWYQKNFGVSVAQANSLLGLDDL